MSELDKRPTGASKLLYELCELETCIELELKGAMNVCLERISEIKAKVSLLKKEAKLPPKFGTFTDTRDGRTYRTVRIGEQTWLAENLAFAYAGSKCYNNDLANADKYGRLYDWNTAKKAVPPGWHIPSDAEWTTLEKFVGNNAGTKLKARSGWNNNGNGTDDYGFSALPGGYGDSSGDFSNVGYYGSWWSATEYYANYAYCRYMYYDYDNVDNYNDFKSNLCSVRCLQDCD